MSGGHDSGLPPKVTRKKKKPEDRTAHDVERPEQKKRKKTDEHGRVMSYVVGVFLFLLGGGMVAGYQFLERGPSKLFNLLMAGGVGALLSGVGLFIQPLDEERLDAFQNEPNPIAVFRIMPIFWKIWLLLILAGMIGGFVYVSQTTVRIGH
jgi:cell division septal protein FtsQ